MSEFFNDSYKNAYMNGLEFTPREQAKGLFKKTFKFEEKLNKDLYGMALSELDEMLTSMGYKKYNVIAREIPILNNYINWAVSNGYSSNKSIRTLSVAREAVNKYIYKFLNTIYTKKDIENALLTDNYLHYMIGRCMFEGIGSSNFEEVRTLQSTMLREDDGRYFVDLADRTMEIEDTLYNDLINYDKIIIDRTMHFKFKETEYIFKPFDRKGSRDELHVPDSIRNRMWRGLKEYFEDDTITKTTVLQSGLNYHIYNEMKKSSNMVLDIEVLKKVGNRYNSYKNESGYYIGKMIDDMNVDFIQTNYGEFEIDESVLQKM